MEEKKYEREKERFKFTYCIHMHGHVNLAGKNKKQGEEIWS